MNKFHNKDDSDLMAFRLLEKLGNTKLSTGKTIKETLKYRDIDIWYLTKTSIYNSYLRDHIKNIISGTSSFNYNKERVKLSLIYHSKKIVSFFRSLRKKSDLGPRENLAYVYAPSHVGSLNPIIKISDEKKFNIIKYDRPFDDSTKKALNKNHLAYNYLESFSDFKTRKKAKSIHKETAKKIKFIVKDNNFTSFKFKDKNVSNDLAKILRLVFLHRKRDEELIEYIELNKKIFERAKPKIVILFDNGTGLGRSAALSARKYNIPSICIQHGSIVMNPISTELTADVFAATGKIDKEYLVNMKADEDKIHVTGQPRFDTITKRSYNSKKIFESLDIDSESKIVTLATQPDFREKIIEILKEIRPQIKNKYNIIVKPHPDESESDYSEVESDEIKIVKDIDLHELINASNSFVNVASTSALEALVLGKPIIVIDSKYSNYTKNLGNVVKNGKELHKAIIKNAGKKNNISKKVEEFVFKSDGRSSERIIKLMKEMK